MRCIFNSCEVRHKYPKTCRLLKQKTALKIEWSTYHSKIIFDYELLCRQNIVYQARFF